MPLVSVMLSVLTFFLFEKQRKNISSFGPDKIFQICGLSTRLSKVEQKLFDAVVKNAL